ncbi:MAG: hypothetical protein Kow0077_16900 [Anaerolineae bacterium]
MPAYIPLTRGQVALVDPADRPALLQYKWHLTTHGYAATRIRING